VADRDPADPTPRSRSLTGRMNDWLRGRGGSRAPAPQASAPTSTQPGMGPRLILAGTDTDPDAPEPGSVVGVAFRVWAPHADAVTVAGAFNGWSATADPLGDEGSGFWSVDVAAARPGDEFKYVLTYDGSPLWRIDPYGAHLTSSVGNSVVPAAFDWTGETFNRPGWNDVVLYELHIGTYNDAPGGPPGALPAVVEKLDHLVALGVTAIQVMPPAEFPGGFSWGYNPSSIFAVESDYGGPDALKALVKAAHARGLAVLCDVVYNHVGPSDLTIWRYDGWSADSDSGGIYFYADARAATPWGERNRPDYSADEVRQFLRDNALSWLGDYRMDGLRWDATAWIRNIDGGSDPSRDLPDGWSLMRWVNDEIAANHPGALSIAEDLRRDPSITTATAAGGAGFASQWDDAFVHPVRAAIITPDDADRDMNAVAAAITNRYGGDVFSRVIYTESHDEDANGASRVPEEIWPANASSWYSKKRSTLGAALVLTSPGIPMLFQGQEFLEDGYFSDDRPLDWSKMDTFAGIFALYRDLVALRRNLAGRTAGLRGQGCAVHHVNQNDKLVAYHRWDGMGPRDSTIVLANFGDRAFADYRVGFPRSGSWRVRFNSDWSGYDASFADTSSDTVWVDAPGRDDMPYSGSIGVGPYTAIILSQDA
jgi:1,4-alpha-glucan branching enzyme